MGDFSKGKMLSGKNVLKYFCNVAAILLLLSVSSAQDRTLEQDVESITQKAKEMKVPQIKKDRKAEQQARQAYEYSRSPEFKAQVEKFKRDLNILLGRETPPVERYYSDYRPKTGRLSEDERIYIFISSSMPEQTIRNYVREACQIGNNTYLILRGGIGGIRKLMPTVMWANEMLKKNPLCEGQCETYPVKILIDPFLFRKYSITRVPAVVYVRGLQNPEGLSEGLNSVKVDSFWISYGDVPLQYHLRLIEKKSGVKILLE